MRAAPIPILAAAVALAGCGQDEPTPPATTTTQAAGSDQCKQVEAPPTRNVKLKPPGATVKGEKLTARVETSCGDFEIDLDTGGSPKTASSFVHMVENGVYEDTTFQRIVPGFVIQGGDPLGDGTGDAGYTVEETPPPDATYTRGVVAMAKTPAEPPGTSGSQFFVVVSADAGLPADYAILGEVSDGDETIAAIESQGVPGAETEPKQPVVIEQITIE
jgi:cyclophilin family peptidyl-prolyl cis-trans isomerase